MRFPPWFAPGKCLLTFAKPWRYSLTLVMPQELIAHSSVLPCEVRSPRLSTGKCSLTLVRPPQEVFAHLCQALESFDHLGYSLGVVCSRWLLPRRCWFSLVSKQDVFAHLGNAIGGFPVSPHSGRTTAIVPWIVGYPTADFNTDNRKGL